LLEERLEAVEVELVAVDSEEVPRCFRLEALLAEHSAELRDVDLDRFPSRLGRLLTPESVEQAVARDDLVGIQQQHCEQASLFRPAHIERPLAVEHFEWTENPKLHARLAPTVAPRPKALKASATRFSTWFQSFRHD